MFDNTQGTLQSIPLPIRGFYYEETRSEPTGAQVSESYVYFDDEGQQQSGERLVDEYENVTYIMQHARHDLKSWEDVERVKHGGNYEFIRYCISKASETDKWVFHDAYLEWLERKPVLDDSAFLERIDDEQEPVFSQALYDAALSVWNESEPQFTPLFTPESVVEGWHLELAKQYRESTVDGVITVYGVDWQVDKPGRDNINEAISYAVRNSLPGTETRNWILADNTLRETTVDELRGVMDAYTERLDEVFTAYAKWRTGDKLEPFVF